MKLVPPRLERLFFAVVDPLIGGLVRIGVRPNTITTIGAGFVIASAVAFGMGSIQLGGLLLLLSGVVDTLDGAVARRTGATSKFGALAHELGEFKGFSPRVVSIEHPLGGVDHEQVVARAHRALESILAIVE